MKLTYLHIVTILKDECIFSNTSTDENLIKTFDTEILKQNLTDEKTQLILSPFI